MRWRELASFRDPAVAKLDHLRRAARAGFRVPTTLWLDAAEATDGVRPPAGWSGPCAVRSASPEEDTAESTQAGRFHSERISEVADEAELAAALARVVASLTRDQHGVPRGAVFLQPWVDAQRAGIAFFDGFHFERSWAAGDNRALTAGEARGTVERGQLARSDAWSRWLERLGRSFRELDRLDLEWAEDEQGFVLLQVRRAPFAVRRDPLVSLANHREILGPAPSPWIVSALERAGAASFLTFARAAPCVAEWDERYAQVAAGRAWMDFSAFFRLMDHWGLPRTFVTEGVGGLADDPRDAKILWPRFLASGVELIRLQVQNVRRVLGMERELRALDDKLDSARDLADLFEVTVDGLATALGVNFALGGALAGVQRVRRALGFTAAANVVTGVMGREYEALRRVAADQRSDALDRWLERFGHRGPLESDPRHPRFRELRDVLLEDLRTGAPEPQREVRSGSGPLYWFERRREAFRDELMKRWQELRERILEEARRAVEAGELPSEDDVFFLTGEDVSETDRGPRAARRREEWAATRELVLPSTAHLSAVEEAARRQDDSPSERIEEWEGVGLGGDVVEGRVLRADDLAAVLSGPGARLGREDVLVVPALEPAWGVLFGRVGAVVAELGGELSHASILLRELGTPAVVNCVGAFGALEDGESVRVDPRAGRVVRLREGAA